MMERRTVLALWERTGSDGVLATVIKVEGSSYRRPGAHLLVSPGGERAGSISGGCLEGEVVRKAAWLTARGPAIQRYSTFFDDPDDIPYGLGCGGTVELLLERSGTPEAKALRGALEAALRGEARLVATVLPDAGSGPDALLRAVWNERGEILFASEGLIAAPDVGTDLRTRDLRVQGERAIEASVEAGRVRTAICHLRVQGASRRVFFQILEPQPCFYVFGAGDDAAPVVKMASLMGWSVVVADGRAHLATPARFPEAQQVVTLAAENLGDLDHLNLRAADAAVLMTHSYEQDRWLLRSLLPRPLMYLGLLGARSRSRDLITDAAAALGWSVEACLERLHAPVGLDLGGDAPEAIALAIVAEVHAHLHRKGGDKRAMSAEELSQLAVVERRACPR